ncbi:hypothetical protein [Lacipirellula sp.]|uniref:hypothetical protein n=1 Tax=Lacipirellula sp. TaxID=2691419 RepID=UPI003D0BA7A7
MNLLDIAKFNLEANQAEVQARVDLMKAYSDFNVRMMEAAKLQAEVAIEHFKLQLLRDAFNNYKRARSLAMKEEKRVARELDRVNLHGRKLPSLLLGETLPADDVSRSWIGLEYFVKTTDADTIGKLVSIKAPSSALHGAHFSKNRAPGTSCEDPPAGITHAWPLLQWARKKLYLPRIGTPPHTLLGKAIEVIGAGADRRRKAVEKELATAQKDLRAIEEKAWENLDITRIQPKTPPPAAK